LERDGTRWNELERDGTNWNELERIGTNWNELERMKVGITKDSEAFAGLSRYARICPNVSESLGFKAAK
jgi:hypothetical protein